MKRFALKIAVTAIVVFLCVLLFAPAIIHADPGDLESITVDPGYVTLGALGQSTSYTATAHYEGGTPADEDVTTTATWEINGPSIATNDGGGLFTATGFGGPASVSATLLGVTGYAELYVVEPFLWVNPGAPGEIMSFSLTAGECSGLSWELVVTKDGNGTVLTASGTIPSNEWNHEVFTTLDAGDYTATYSIGGTVQKVQTFSIWGFDAWLDVSVGYAGENTTFTLNATNSSGKTADFWLLIEIGDDTWDIAYEEDDISIDSDDWSYTITRTLEAGNYWASYWVEDYGAGGYEFSVVNRGIPQPPVVKKKASVKHDSPINEKPLSSYEKTASGFATLFYNRILHRNPEKEGLDAWIARLGSGEITGADLIQQFIFGEECQKVISGYSNEEFIKYLYKALFNRTPEADGLNAWLARMSAGMIKEEVVKQFGLSEEFVILCNFFGIKPYPGYIENSN